MKRLVTAGLVLAFVLPGAAAASTPTLGYVTAGHALAAELLKKGLPVAKRQPDVKCFVYLLKRYSPTLLQGRFVADDCKGNGFVILVAARQDGSTVTGWAGKPCRTTGPTKKLQGTIIPGCDLGSLPW